MRVSTKIITLTFYRGAGLGAIATRSQRNVNKNGGFSLLHQILHTRRVDSPVLRLIQSSARGRGDGGGSGYFY